ncbi:hypothetical protein N0V85_003832 [Neurospora sp. IMI 360204]|nr:hypothetical protein N0V85_003832 [Neurospora sp. IMI 360204]
MHLPALILHVRPSSPTHAQAAQALGELIQAPDAVHLSPDNERLPEYSHELQSSKANCGWPCEDSLTSC